MTLSTVPDSHHLLQRPALPGSHAGTPTGSPTWALAAGRAMSLRARHASELVVVGGRVWAPLDTQHGATAGGSEDLILEAGAHLPLAAGQRVVLEPLRGPVGAQASVTLLRQTRSYPLPLLLRETGAVLRGAALGALRGALAGARAARAASSASRAQGAMACGESMASSGAL